MNYIERIKWLKNEKKITNEQLSELSGIPLGTLSKLLAGIGESPKLANIVAIADALGCSLDYIVSGVPDNHNNYTLNAEEMRMMERFRRLDQHARELVELVIDKELDRLYPDEREGRGKQEESIPLDVTHHRVNYMEASGALARRPVLLYELPVSAGNGVYLDDTKAERIQIPDNEKTESVEYAIRISGNSMEPAYRDGDILLVENCESVEVGELGIFVLDGDGFFKKFGGDRLMSLNPAYGDILLRNFEEAVCCGRVIGKLKRR